MTLTTTMDRDEGTRGATPADGLAGHRSYQAGVLVAPGRGSAPRRPLPMNRRPRISFGPQCPDRAAGLFGGLYPHGGVRGLSNL